MSQLPFIPAWLSQLNEDRQLMRKHPSYRTFAMMYNHSLSNTNGELRIWLCEQLGLKNKLNLTSLATHVSAPALSAQPAASKLAQAGYYFVPDVGLVDDFDGTPVNTQHHQTPLSVNTAALFCQFLYPLLWMVLSFIALSLFLRSPLV